MSELVRPDTCAYFAANCSKLTHGRCLTLRCLRRGGWNGKPPVPDGIATCEELEAVASFALLARQAETIERLREAAEREAVALFRIYAHGAKGSKTVADGDAEIFRTHLRAALGIDGTGGACRAATQEPRSDAGEGKDTGGGE